MWNHIRPAVVSFLSLTVITGVIYPALVTAAAKVPFGHQAGGSLIEQNGRVIGSELIGQSFDDPKYFWPRPSAVDYDATAGAGSNLGPSNPVLGAAVAARIKCLEANGVRAARMPVDLLTASGSGLDPHLSPTAAAVQVERVAKARGMSRTNVDGLVDACTEGRTFGLLGEPRVNVLRLNLMLDGISAGRHAAAPQAEIGFRARAFLPDSH